MFVPYFVSDSADGLCRCRRRCHKTTRLLCLHTHLGRADITVCCHGVIPLKSMKVFLAYLAHTLYCIIVMQYVALLSSGALVHKATTLQTTYNHGYCHGVCRIIFYSIQSKNEYNMYCVSDVSEVLYFTIVNLDCQLWCHIT